MSGGPPDSVERRFRAWSAGVRRHSRAILILAPFLVAFLGVYAERNLSVDTDTSSLVSEDLPYRRAYRDYQEALPGGDELVVLIEARTPGLADDAARRLAATLEEADDVIESVHAPGLGPFFDRHALLYHPLDSLEALVERVEGAADLLRTLGADPTLAGLSAALDDALAADLEGAPGPDPDLAPVLGLLTAGAYAAAQGRFEPVPWDVLVRGRPPSASDRRRTLTVRPHLAFENAVPGRAALERVREAASDLGLTERNGVTVRLTGGVAIEAEELVSAVDAVRGSGFLALVSVAIILFLALRSVRLILASLVTLVAGLVATAAFAAFAVGSLNLISVAFAVLYIGLGIDYAIHLTLRYRSLRSAGADPDAAIDGAVGTVGPSLALSAVTTAACFYAFVPTDFTGVSDLGVIGGTGMFVSLLATLALLPAILTVAPLSGPASAGPPDPATAGVPDPATAGVPDPATAGLPELGEFIRTNRIPILAAAAAITIGALVLVPGARFDHNPLNLRDPESESVVAYRALLADPVAKPLSVSVLRRDTAEVRETGERVAGLSVVEGARSILDFVPEDQGAKLPVLRRLGDALGGPASAAAPEGAGESAADSAGGSTRSSAAALERIRASLTAYRWGASGEERRAARRLYHVLNAWARRMESWPASDRPGHFAALEDGLVGALETQVDRLRSAATATPVTLDSLPASLRERWIATDGRLRVEILPAEPLVETAELRRYVDGVREVVPDATGSAVSELETGRVASAAFRSALGLAGLVTIALLLVLQRNLRVVALVAGPLLLAAAWTVGLTVVLDLPFNFANVIALPLLLGVGVDNGIHMVHQAGIARGAQSDPMEASTSRATLYASLTTMASFGNLAFAAHVGMASMGRLLAVGMACVLAATLLVLPALMRPGRS